MKTTTTNDFTVLKVDLERLRQRLACADARYASMPQVHEWLRANRFVSTARPEIYVRGRDATGGELLDGEVVSATSYV
jgi:hypothetical protein